MFSKEREVNTQLNRKSTGQPHGFFLTPVNSDQKANRFFSFPRLPEGGLES